jgi:hypothetical protein
VRGQSEYRQYNAEHSEGFDLPQNIRYGGSDYKRLILFRIAALVGVQYKPVIYVRGQIKTGIKTTHALTNTYTGSSQQKENDNSRCYNYH